jgi:tRNA-dihydrouridine synthase B
MAGISDLSFRMLNREFGCELAYIEMINSRSISYRSKRTHKMMETCPGDKPLGVQLLGCEEKFVSKALDVLERYKFDTLDFNAACPAKKVVRRGEGSALLKHPEKLGKLIRLIVKNSKVPVTVKVRSGWDAHSINIEHTAKLVEDSGAVALFVHGRTRMQGYSGSVDYSAIRKAKKAVNIPLIASGDVLSAELAKKMFDETGCDGICVARGSLGHPWIFKEIKDYLKKGKLRQHPEPDEIFRVMKGHLERCIDFHGERNGVMIFRKFFIWYTKGFRKVRTMREKSSRVKTKLEMFGLIDGLSGLINKNPPIFSGVLVGDRPC